MNISEEILHSQICEYLRIQYPKILFKSDMSGIRLTIGQAKKVKKLRSSNAFPDIEILEKSYHYNALFLEVKKETPYRKNGKLKKQTAYEIIGGIRVKYDHLQRQNKVHEKLRERGYMAEFVWTLDMTMQIVDEYLNL